jgi:hypothetical protein
VKIDYGMDVSTEWKITNYYIRQWNESNTALEKGQTAMNLEWRYSKLIRVKGLLEPDVENHEMKTWHEGHLKEKT